MYSNSNNGRAAPLHNTSTATATTASTTVANGNGAGEDDYLYDVDDSFWKSPIGVPHVNWLIKVCNIVQENPITSLRQCSSSLFVLLFQRLLGFGIPNLELEPNTQEKKLWNIHRVLEELSLVGDTDLSYISASEIVNCNEEQVSMLIRVFLHLAVHLIRAQQLPLEHQHHHVAAPSSHSEGDELMAVQQQQQQAQQPGEAHHAYLHHLVPPYHKHPPDPSTVTNTSSTDVRGKGALRPDSAPPPRVGASPSQPVQRLAAETLAAMEEQLLAHQGEAAASSAASEADSAAFTNELVEGWKMDLVPPARRPAGGRVDPIALVQVRQRMDRLENAVVALTSKSGRRLPRPDAHDSRQHALEETAERVIRQQAIVSHNNAQRDAKIEAIRARRIQESLQHELRREVIIQRSATERQLLESFRENVAIENQTKRDRIRWLKEEDAATRRAVEALVASERNQLHLNSALLTDETSRMIRKHSAAVREARRTLKEKQSALSRINEDVIEQYRSQVSSWCPTSLVGSLAAAAAVAAAATSSSRRRRSVGPVM